MQFDENFMKNYKELLIGVFIIILLAALGLKYVAGNASKTKEYVSANKAQKAQLKEVQVKFDEVKKIKQEMTAKQSKIKPVFSQKAAPEDSIASFGGMFEDIIDYVKMNGLRLRSVEYIINPADDPIYSVFPSLYNVCRINIFVIATYGQMEGFLRDLTVYPYFINISSIDITPYEKDKEYLLVNISITLYSKKQQSVGSVLQ